MVSTAMRRDQWAARAAAFVGVAALLLGVVIAPASLAPVQGLPITVQRTVATAREQARVEAQHEATVALQIADAATHNAAAATSNAAAAVAGKVEAATPAMPVAAAAAPSTDASAASATVIPQMIPLTARVRTASEEEEYFALLDEHHENVEAGMIMHLELGEELTAELDETTDAELGGANAHFYRFGRLRGSAIVDESTGRVKEYKLPLIDINNSQYVGRIQVGTPRKGVPQQEFDVIFDTGSSNLWLNADSCASEGCLIHRRFHPAKSTTYKKLPIEMSVQFGTGSIEGFLAQDTFTLGPVRVHDQTFGQIKRSTGSVFVTGKFDGILGLSFPSLSAHSYKPVFDSIMSQKLLANNMFSFYYSLLPKQTSAIMLGQPLPSMYQGPLHWIKVSKPFYWQVNLIDIEYDGVSTHACPSPPCKAVVDTGTSLLTGPSEYTLKLMKQLGVARSCTNLSQLKKLTYILSDEHGEYRFDLDPHYYVLKSQTMRPDTGLPKFCRAGVMALDVPRPRGPLFILGDVFMRKYYTVFDRDGQRIGLGLAKE